MPYKDPDKQRENVREATQRWRLKKKLEQQQKDPLDLNAGMKPLEDDFPSKEYFEELLGHEMSDTEYIKLKVKSSNERKELMEKREKEETREYEQVMLLVAFNPKTRGKCIRFRNSYLSMNIQNEDFDIQNHNAVCDYCGRWLATYTTHYVIGGINLHHPEQEPEPYHRGHNWKPICCQVCGSVRRFGRCPNGCDG